MKTLKAKNKNEAVWKWMCYVAGAYLLASWGVNGVLNPMYYVKSAWMCRQTLEISECEDGILLEPVRNLQSDKLEYEDKMNFLSFRITQAESFSFDLQLLVYLQEETMEMSVRVWKGWNTVSLNNKAGEKIVAVQAVPKSGAVVFADAKLSEHMWVDTGKMVCVWAFFLMLMVFWEGIWWMKERYAE